MFSSILIVEDDKSIRDYLRDLLLENRYSVKVASTGLKGMEMAETFQPDLILLDLKLPDIRGEEFCRKVKKLLPDTIVFILSAKDSTESMVTGLDLGADDYMTKPFESEELIARIKARLRKNGDGNVNLSVGNVILDRNLFEVKRGDEVISLTPQELKLFEYLLENKNRVLTRDMILSKVWQYSPDIESRVVDVYIGYLRKKLEKKGEPKIIQSVRGFGYTIKDN
jgi:DNA-binding response OmpR family regulator